MRIKFTQDTSPREDSDDEGNSVTHKKGETLECNDASARRWLRRGAAEAADAKPGPKSA